MRPNALFLADLPITCCAAQDPDGALELVLEGVQLHDEGRQEQAMERYAGALEMDCVNFMAHYGSRSPCS